MADEARHLALFTIPTEGPSAFLDVLAGIARVVNIPDGAVIHRVGYDETRDALVIVMKHGSFPVVPAGERIPEVPLMCVRGDEGVE